MTKNNPYAQHISIGGWSRVDMLLEIYDKAIDSLSAAQKLQNANSNEYRGWSNRLSGSFKN